MDVVGGCREAAAEITLALLENAPLQGNEAMGQDLAHDALELSRKIIKSTAWNEAANEVEVDTATVAYAKIAGGFYIGGFWQPEEPCDAEIVDTHGYMLIDAGMASNGQRGMAGGAAQGMGAATERPGT